LFYLGAWGVYAKSDSLCYSSDIENGLWVLSVEGVSDIDVAVVILSVMLSLSVIAICVLVGYVLLLKRRSNSYSTL
jgi:hypothetical protein